MKTKIATVIVMAMASSSAIAQNFDNQVFTNQDVRAVELSQAEMKETQGEVLPLVALTLGGAAIGMWAKHGESLYKTGRPASISEVSEAGAVGAMVGSIGRVGATRWNVPKIGGEIKTPSKNFRLAPIGNSTGHPIGKFPHYHRRGAINPKTGQPSPGQGIGRHRPWEKSKHDKTWRDRF